MTTNEIDRQVNEWMLEKFLWSREYDKQKHGTIGSIRVLSVDMGWECGCWSEWTRDDGFELTAKFVGDKGEFTWTYGRWAGLPGFIQELDEYINGNTCMYEEGDDDDDFVF